MTNQQSSVISNETQKSSYFIKIWKFITHPVVLTCITLVVSFWFFILGRVDKMPAYAISKSELIARTSDNENKLKLFWDEREIKNAASIKIALWNSGRMYINKWDISTTNPIRIKPSGQVNILSVSILTTSRRELDFETNIEKDLDGSDSIIITIKGDEALERLDGATFHILFSGQKDSLWRIIGRIKGAPKGFELKYLYERPQHAFGLFLGFIVSLLALIMNRVELSKLFIYNDYKPYLPKEYKNRKVKIILIAVVWLFWLFIISTMLGCFIGFVMHENLIYSIPNWLSI